MKNIKTAESHNFDNIKYICNQSTDLDETGTKLLRNLYSTTLPIQIDPKLQNKKNISKGDYMILTKM
jgi:hypothetical protein